MLDPRPIFKQYGTTSPGGEGLYLFLTDGAPVIVIRAVRFGLGFVAVRTDDGLPQVAGLYLPLSLVLAAVGVAESSAELVKIVSLDEEPWDQHKEGSIDHCRHCHAPEYRPHHDDCVWVREQSVRDSVRDALAVYRGVR